MFTPSVIWVIMFLKRRILQNIFKELKIEAMLSRKYLKNYSNVMLKSLDMYSEDTILKLEDSITSEERLLKIEQFMTTNPTEKELLEMLEQEFPTTT